MQRSPALFEGRMERKPVHRPTKESAATKLTNQSAVRGKGSRWFG